MCENTIMRKMKGVECVCGGGGGEVHHGKIPTMLFRLPFKDGLYMCDIFIF